MSLPVLPMRWRGEEIDEYQSGMLEVDVGRVRHILTTATTSGAEVEGWQPVELAVVALCAVQGAGRSSKIAGGDAVSAAVVVGWWWAARRPRGEGAGQPTVVVVVAPSSRQK